ncbi:hypothetical protein [Streptomyces sp. NPDC056883]|uniref:hypothetical protein n=1 Tax=Streptomyces sp. NPDC056883 TaxID=3345959 RepID=UPI003678C9DF
MKKNTAPQAALPARAATAAPAQVPAAPGESRVVFRFAFPTEERTHHREDYAPVR